MLLTSLPVSAHWELSLGGSLGLSVPRVDTVWAKTYYSSAPVLAASFSAEYYPLPWLSVSAGTRYTSKGILYVHTHQGYPTDAVIFGDSALEFPLMLRFTMTRESHRYSLALGGYVGWRFGRMATGYMDNVPVDHTRATSRKATRSGSAPLRSPLRITASQAASRSKSQWTPQRVTGTP